MRVLMVGLGLLLAACQAESQAMGPTAVPATATTDERATLVALQQNATQVSTATLLAMNTPMPAAPQSGTTPSAAPQGSQMAPVLEPSSTVLPPTVMPTTAAPPATPTPSPAPPTPLPTTPPAATAPAVALAPALAETVEVFPTQPSSTPPPTPVIYPTNTPRATQVVLRPISPTPDFTYDGSQPLQDHYWFARPFNSGPGTTLIDYASRNYPYGSTSYGQFRVHHGVDITNPNGTVILAAASGTVIYAGDDLQTLFGPKNDFYGNLVVIEHDRLAPNGQPLYTLYGHMSSIEVEVGQYVELQERIGRVGSTGAALGSHLHFEVRIGDPYDYDSTYNPDLWLRPWPGFGTLAGRLVDRDGNRVYEANIIIQPASNAGPDRYAFSYADESVNPDLYYGEHYTRGDLPAGDYTVYVRIRGVLRFEGDVTVESGQTTWLDIVLR
ncbi:MAG: peptidoglycan DD-metalloendopeptidase family protein [Chloroflexi bacterium]|nr:peptidoglycan DD-metalloendopeptidase family protein [Chloroflexota bacterium]